MNAVQQVQAHGQSIWLDYIRRGIIRSGELKQMVRDGISGLTANPSILEKAIVGSDDYDEALVELAQSGKTAEQVYEGLAIEDIRQAADMLRPVYDRTGGADGFACLEISPRVAYDTVGTISEGRRLFAMMERPNVMVKVPTTPQGIPAIRRLTADGINVNVTLIFALDVYQQAVAAYIEGLEDLYGRGGDVRRVASVASFFLSRLDTAVDALLEDNIRKGREDHRPLLGKTAIASAKTAYARFKETFYGDRFAEMRRNDAHVQRLLWASTGTKNPAYSDVMYVESLIGRDTVNTLPPVTIQAFNDHGKVDVTLERGIGEAEHVLRSLAAVGIDLKQVTDKLLTDGVKAFDDSYTKIMVGVNEKKAKLTTSVPVSVETDLGRYEALVKKTLAKLLEDDVAARIWKKDYTVWKPDPEEITDRLGWLTVTDLMQEQAAEIESFAREVRDAGFRHVVLLGMGGSSLGAEVMRAVFGSDAGFPRLIVLDSTLPSTLKAVTDAIDPARTLFVVSSKSGTTTEPLILHRYFRNLVEKAGIKEVGRNFIAITDPGTPLAKMGEEQNFRRVFLNPPDIGGRYSVLSFFGLVPAALAGIDIKVLLDRADQMREGCASCVLVENSPGSWLGACIGCLTLEGRDKLTLVTSPTLASFGLWVEQLIAESTGKDGRGIVPVASEPLASPECYGSDRLFVYLRLKGDDNAATDAAVRAIKTSDQPLIVLDMRDRFDLGGEFFRWEFATAVAGVILGVHPFNQPDVQKAKDATERVLGEYQQAGRLPEAHSAGKLSALFSRSQPGDYFDIMAYVHQTTETDGIFSAWRQWVMQRYHIATTLGYGPRFLHSTGQLHKGGPNTGLFLQITAAHQTDLPVPGMPYSFGVVADAQALGDLQALQAAGRRVVSLRAERDDAVSLKRLLAGKWVCREQMVKPREWHDSKNPRCPPE